MAPGQLVRVRDLPPELEATAVAPADSADWEKSLRDAAHESLVRGEPKIFKDLNARFERVLIEAALKHTSGKKQDAARKLGLGRNTLTRKLKELGLPDAR